MKKLIALSALLLVTGCASWEPDGQIAGMVPVEAIEQPLNVMVPGAGTAIVSINKAAVSRLQSPAFPLSSVTTNYYDANNQEIVPPFRRVETPVYGPRVTEIAVSQQPPAPKIDTAALIKAIQSAQQPGPAPDAATPAIPLTEAERAALEALGVK